MAESFLRSLGIYLMIYFVFLKASKPLKNKWKWINYGIKPALVLTIVSNIAVIIYVEV